MSKTIIDVARKLSPAASELVPVVFNFVGRDHNQGAFRNGQVSTDPESLAVATHFDSLNQNGPSYFGKFEGGGQEPGATAMSFRDPLKMFKAYVDAMPNGTKIRSLTRGGFGNSVVPINSGDLGKWLSAINKETSGRTDLKIFDYNTNLEELERCVEIAKELGMEIEIAIPHSPEESYQPFFATKVDQAAKFAAKHGASLSVKRMVAGFTVEEAKRVGDIVFAAAIENGITSVGLHAHGDVPEAVAEFAKVGHDHGVLVNVDFVHKGSGPRPDAPGTFPSFYDIVEQLAKRGVNVSPSSEQVSILGKIDGICQKRDKAYKVLRVGGSWKDDSKVDMGMPDGGEAYSVEAIEKSPYSKLPGMNPQLAKDIFEVYYKEFRERFAMPTSVTPGHKRIETGAIYSIERTIEPILEGCKTDGVVDLDKVAEKLKSKTYEKLYSGLSPEIIDAFRNNKLPQPLTKEAFQFLCAENMRNTLKQGDFKDLIPAAKERLISMAHDSDAVKEFANQLVDGKLLPPEVLTGKDKEFCKISLVQASGERQYLESAKAPERFKACYEEISERAKEGFKVGNINIAAIVAAAVTGGDTTYVNGTYNGSLPSAEGLTKEEYLKAVADFYANNLVSAVSRGVFKPGPEVLTIFATEGLLSGSVIDETGKDQPGAEIKPVEAVKSKEAGKEVGTGK